MTPETKCEHCGAEAPLLPTPEGFHCETCYSQLMGPALAAAGSGEDEQYAGTVIISDPIVMSAEVLAGLYAVCSGKLQHVFMGACPDALEGDQVRDDECPACRAMIASDGLLRAAGVTLPAASESV